MCNLSGKPRQNTQNQRGLLRYKIPYYTVTILERDFFRHILKYWEGKTLHENCALDGLMIDSPFFARTLLTCVSDVGRGCNLHVINTKLRINYYFSTLFRKTNASMGVKHKLFCQADMYYVFYTSINRFVYYMP